MSGKRRSTGQISRDRRLIADLYLQGWLQSDIASEIKRSPATVSRDIKTLQGQWLKSSLIDFDNAKAGELAKIDRLEREYWVGWARSCQDAKTDTKKTKGLVQQIEDADARIIRQQPIEDTVVKKGQAGDPRFLNGIQWCIDRRCKILGIDAPVRQEFTGKDGEPLLHKVYIGVSPDDWDDEGDSPV